MGNFSKMMMYTFAISVVFVIFAILCWKMKYQLQKAKLFEAKHNSLIEFNNYAVLSIDLEGNIQSVNKAGLKITGYTMDELLEMSIFDLARPESYEMRSFYLEKATKGETIEIEVEIVHKEGHIVKVRITKIPIFMNDNIIGIYERMADITEESKIKEMFEDLNSLEVAIWCYDAISNDMSCSPGIEKIYGYSPNELSKNRELWRKVVHPDDVETVTIAYQKLLSKKSDISEFRIVSLHGEVRWVQNRSIPILNTSDQLTGFKGVVIDITAQKRFAEQNDLVDANFLENLDIAVWIWDLRSQTLLCSPGIAKICNIDANKIVQNPNIWKDITPQEEWSIVDAHVKTILTGKTDITEYRALRPKGEVRWVQSRGTPIFNDSGELIAIKGVIIDITEQKNAEQKIIKNVYLNENMDSSARLRLLMAEKGISTIQLAELTNLTRATISNLRNGKISKPQYFTARAIADALGIKLSEIWPEMEN